MIREFGYVEFAYLLKALQATLGLSVIAFVGGGVFGLAVAFMRVSPVAPLRWLASAWIQLFQATPLLMLLFLVFFGLALFGLSQNAFISVAVALTCSYGRKCQSQENHGEIDRVMRHGAMQRR